MPAERRREHFGAGALSLDPATSVFLNCPYDPEYLSLFDAAVLATACCGFTPRSALESGTVAEPRMTRITQAIFKSKYSIHDLTRCTGEGDANLARFNMPLELGIAMARRYLARRGADRHDWLVMVPARPPIRPIHFGPGRIRSRNSQRLRPRLGSRCHDMVGHPSGLCRYAFSPNRYSRVFQSSDANCGGCEKPGGSRLHRQTWFSPRLRSQNNSDDNQPSATE